MSSAHSFDLTVFSTASARVLRCSAVMPGGATTERQLTTSTSMPCSFRVGTSTPAIRCAGGHGERAHLAGLDLAFELAVARDAGRDLAADDRRDRLAAARKGDVVDLGDVAAGGLGEQRSQDVVGAAGRTARPSHLADIRLHGGGEVLDRLVRRVRRHDDDERIAGEARDRRHHVEIDGRLVGQDRPDHGDAVDHQLIAVALRRVDELGQTDGAAGAGDVGHLHVLGDARRGHHLLQRAGRGVPAAARTGRRHDLQLELGMGRGREHGHRGREGGSRDDFTDMFHDDPPWMVRMGHRAGRSARS